MSLYLDILKLLAETRTKTKTSLQRTAVKSLAEIHHTPQIFSTIISLSQQAKRMEPINRNDKQAIHDEQGIRGPRTVKLHILFLSFVCACLHVFAVILQIVKAYI
jgi:hypothetical protein